MALIDLRGREKETPVRTLLAEAHGTTESAERALERYRAGEWILLGWEANGSVLACAGVEERAGEDVVLHSLAVASLFRGRGIGRLLLEAIGFVRIDTL